MRYPSFVTKTILYVVCGVALAQLAFAAFGVLTWQQAGRDIAFAALPVTFVVVFKRTRLASYSPRRSLPN
jgi:Na+/proline symporter